MAKFKWDIFDHPPYSPNLVPIYFHLFPQLKVHLDDQCFVNNNEVKSADGGDDWLKEMDTTLYGSKIKKLFLRHQKHIDLNGDCVKK